MKMPQTPPAIDKMLEALFTKEGNRAPAVLSQLNAETPDRDRYFHWDELRFRPPPSGLSVEEWWLVTKLKRKSVSNTIPLKDKTAHSFRWCSIPMLSEHLQRIDTSLGGIMETPEVATNPETRDRYIIRGLVEESISSSQLEGAVTTREVAKQLIRSGRPPRDKGERMILNNYRTMRRIREIGDTALSPEVVFELHRIITEGTLDNPEAAGRFRTQAERVQVEDTLGIVFHDPPVASELPQRLTMMCDFANGTTPTRFIHPVLRAIMLHFWLAYDHPFVDGNGRIARALFYWLMVRNRYWLCEFISISHVILRAPVKYYRAFLHTETDENDLTYFLIHQLDVLLKAIDELHDFIRRQVQKMAALKSRLRGINSLNHRQRALVEHALSHSNAEYTIDEHQASHGVVYQTARADLLDLEKRGLVTSTKIGRTYHFRPVTDLEARLAAIG